MIIKRVRNPVINCDMSTFSKFFFRQVKICEESSGPSCESKPFSNPQNKNSEN